MFKKLELQQQIKQAKARHDFIKAGMLQAELDNLPKDSQCSDDDIFNIFSAIFNPQEKDNGTIRNND